ncbi:MAG: Rab family GTPase [Promethearchaeota archaeon]
MYDYTFKVVLAGESEGKTSFTKRFCYNIFNPSERLTIGVDFHVKTVEFLGKRSKLQIWDVGGEERFRFLLPTYCLGASAAILMYDITRPSSLENISEWVRLIRSRSGNIPIILVGSKLHSRDSQLVSRQEGILTAENFNLSAFAEVCPETGQNVENVFETLVELMIERCGGEDSINRTADSSSFEETEEFFRGIPDIDELFRSIFGEFNPFGGFDDFGFGGFGQRARGRAAPHREVGKDIKNKPKRKPVYFKINDFLELKLENGRTNIYVGGLLFRQCKYLLLNINSNNFESYENIDSIDEAAEKLDHSMETRGSNIPPRTEFWGHCSNLQAWYENNYDTRILHRNLAFPLLKALADAGDKLAKRVFKEQLAIRLESGYPSVVIYLVKQGYLNHLTEEELETILETPRFIKSIPKWFDKFKDIPYWLSIKIKRILLEFKESYENWEPNS